MKVNSVCYCFFLDVFVSKLKEQHDDAASADEPGDEASSITQLQDPDKYREVFRARKPAW
jgi:hypothetical protein